MTMYEDQQDEPPAELELEQQRAGVDTGADPVNDDVAPLWVAGLGPPSGDCGRLSPLMARQPPTRDRIANPIGMFTRHRR